MLLECNHEYEREKWKHHRRVTSTLLGIKDDCCTYEDAVASFRQRQSHSSLQIAEAQNQQSTAAVSAEEKAAMQFLDIYYYTLHSLFPSGEEFARKSLKPFICTCISVTQMAYLYIAFHKRMNEDYIFYRLHQVSSLTSHIPQDYIA